MKNTDLSSSAKQNNSRNLNVLIIFCISISYVFFGFIGDALTDQANEAAAIWPSSGIALASCLIWGRKVWLGIFIGAFIINARIGFDLTSFQSIIHSTLLVSTISFGAVLQALTGHFLITRKSSKANLFQSSEDIFRLLCLGGILSCLVSASIGVTSLVFAGFIPLDHYLTNWLIWWLGDTIGVVV